MTYETQANEVKKKKASQWIRIKTTGDHISNSYSILCLNKQNLQILGWKSRDLFLSSLAVHTLLPHSFNQPFISSFSCRTTRFGECLFVSMLLGVDFFVQVLLRQLIPAFYLQLHTHIHTLLQFGVFFVFANKIKCIC